MYISSSGPGGSGEVTPERRSTEAGAKQMFGMADEHNLGLTYAAQSRAGSVLFIPVNNVNTLFERADSGPGVCDSRQTGAGVTGNICHVSLGWGNVDDRTDQTANNDARSLLTAYLLTFEAAAESKSLSLVCPRQVL